MPEIRGTHSAQIEREQRGYQWIRDGVPGRNVAPPPQIKNWSITQQEQPDHPLPRVSAGKQGPNVAPPPQIKTWSVTVQEWPDHPQPYVRRGVAIPNVAAPPQIGAAKTVQEWPDERQAFVRPGVQGPNVAAPPQVRSTAITVQERPLDLQAVVRGPYFAIVTAPPPGFVRTIQEQPDHPLPKVGIGIQGPNVAPPPQIGGIVVRQEQPDHPGPFTWKHYTVAVAVTFGPGTRQVITTQEQPHHPFGGTLIAIQGPNVGPPVTQSASARQEAPDEKQAFVRPGVPGPNVASPPQIKNYAATVQEWPDEKQAFRWTHFTLPPPLTATPQGRAVTTQEQPDHPLPKTGIGIQGPNVGPPVTRTAIVVQEYPPEYQARTGPGIQGPNVAPPITRTAITQQEQPDHPLPRVRTGIQGPNVASGIGSIFTKQEQPDHPGPFFVGFQFPPPVIVTAKPETRIVITRQEWPDFPPNPGFTWPGTPPIFVPPPPVTTPPPGGGKRRKKGLPKYVSPIRTMTAGDLARAKIATKMRKKDITEEEMRFLLSLLDDED